MNKAEKKFIEKQDAEITRQRKFIAVQKEIIKECRDSNNKIWCRWTKSNKLALFLMAMWFIVGMICGVSITRWIT